MKYEYILKKGGKHSELRKNDIRCKQNLLVGLCIILFLLNSPASAVDPLIAVNTTYYFDNHEIVLAPKESLQGYVPSGFNIQEVSPGVGTVLFVTVNANSSLVGSYKALYTLIAVDQYESAPKSTVSFYLAKVYTDNIYYKYFLDTFSNVTDIADFEIKRSVDGDIITDFVSIEDESGEIFKLNSTSDKVEPQILSINIYKQINDGVITLQLNRNHTKVIAAIPGEVELRENTILWNITGSKIFPTVITSWSTIDIKETQSLFITSNNGKDVTDSAVNWLKLHQSADGSWLEYVPFTAVSIIGALDSNTTDGRLMAEKGVNWLLETQRTDGSWSRPRRMPTWDTELAIIAISEAGNGKKPSPIIKKGSDWLISTQQQDGGLSWDPPGTISDADDTAYGIISLIYGGKENGSKEVEAAKNKLLQLQNIDGGWPTWMKGGNGIDSSQVDITAHVIEALTAAGVSPDSPEIQNGASWIEQQQLPEGNWTGIWYRDYTYSTMTGIIGLHAAGRPVSSPNIKKAVKWIKQNQNRDGGWGSQKGVHSTAEETSWALYGLILVGEDPDSNEIRNGIEWLIDNQETEGNWNKKQDHKDDHFDHKKPSGVWSPSYVGIGGTGLGYYDTLLPTSFSLRTLGLYEKIKHDNRVKQIIKKGIKYLEKEQSKEGYWVGFIPSHADATGLAVLALLNYGFEKNSSQVQKATTWLIDNQNKDGGWVTGDPSLPSDIDSTSIVLDVLIQTNAPQDTISKAKAFIESHGGYESTTWSKSLLARDDIISWNKAKLFPPLEIIYSQNLFFQAIPLLYQYSFVPAQLINYEHIYDKRKATEYLASTQNPDGGFALRPGEPSSTRWNYNALHALQFLDGLNEINRSNAINFVKNSQNEDGGFGSKPGDPSNMIYTYTSIHALSILDGLNEINTQKAIEYIVSTQNPDGGFGIQPNQPSFIAFDYNAINALDILDSLDSIDRIQAIEYIVNTQNTDGGWGTPTSEPVLTTTAIHPMSILGGLDMINREKAVEYLISCQNPDGGFGVQPGMPSDLVQSGDATRALEILNNSNKMDLRKATNFFVKSQNSNGGFGPSPLQVSDLRNTYKAVFTLEGFLYSRE